MGNNAGSTLIAIGCIAAVLAVTAFLARELWRAIVWLYIAIEEFCNDDEK